MSNACYFLSPRLSSKNKKNKIYKNYNFTCGFVWGQGTKTEGV
jgi:hypothetical protein